MRRCLPAALSGMVGIIYIFCLVSYPVLLLQGAGIAAAQAPDGFEVFLESGKPEYALGLDSATVSGRVYYGGHVLPGAQLSLELADTSGPLAIDQVLTDGQGAFQWVIPPGTFKIEGLHKVYVKVSGTASLASVEFRVTAPVLITGWIKNQDGSAFGGAKVALLHNGQQKYEAIADSQGVFTLPDVLPGSYRMDSSFPGYRKVCADLEIKPGAGVTLEPLILTATSRSDLDGSGDISDEDIIIILNRYRLKAGDPGWDPAYDVFPDGKIDIKDLVSTGRIFGENF
ncbi:MAG: carboxypeptidase regulatory-like domain-containing protein [Firmicutes bacterium]|nr:carboxypeptidase regulatory-like domain-containing protein [Bacillota bacterium]